MPNDLAPEIVEMKDRSGQSYLVDADVSYLLTNRKVWTAPDTKLLMIEDKGTWIKNMVFVKPLAEWILRILSTHDLPDTLDVTFRDGNARNCCHRNLVRKWRGAI